MFSKIRCDFIISKAGPAGRSDRLGGNWKVGLRDTSRAQPVM